MDNMRKFLDDCAERAAHCLFGKRQFIAEESTFAPGSSLIHKQMVSSSFGMILLFFLLFAYSSSAELSEDEEMPFDFDDQMIPLGTRRPTLPISQEFQTDNPVASSTLTTPQVVTEILLSTSSFSSNIQMECPAETTFLKHHRIIRHSVPKLSIRTNSLSDCSQSCRQQKNPENGSHLDCWGFSFSGKSFGNICDLYGEQKFEVTEKPENRSNYFERICLRVPKECETKAYSFELHEGKFLESERIGEYKVGNRNECLQLCVENERCRSLNFHRSNFSCQLLDRNSQMGFLSVSADSDFFENFCVRETQRCDPSRRIDFVVTRGMKVGNSLELSVGPLSIRNCMRECVESKEIFCRSLQYNGQTRECLLVDESSWNGVHSTEYDLYEPICLNSDVDLPCPGDWAFERVSRLNLVTEEILSHLKEMSLSECMESCLSDGNCLSFTYHRTERRCKILPLNRKSPQIRSIVENFIDYYELACDRKGILRQNVSPIQIIHTTPLPSTPRLCNGTLLIEKGRTLRIEYRNLHHVNVRTLDKCQQLCREATLKCLTFAYNHRTTDCLLSTTVVDKSHQKFNFITQQSPNYDLYSFMGRGCGVVASAITTERPQFVEETTETTVTQHFSNSLDSDDPFGSLFSSSLVSSSTFPSARRLKDQKIDGFGRSPLLSQSLFTTTAFPTIQMTTVIGVPSPLPTVIPHRDHRIERLATDQIRVSAMCLESGVNVTFSVENSNYTGAVYAAERFSQCRVFVDSKNRFSIFVTRPSIHNLCNAFEENKELTAVLVLSNDMVLPYDVTTKDDFFYQITCDYSKGEQNSVIRTGIVVGGPEPKSIMSSTKKSEEKQNHVFLKILKNGHSVTNVFIGEKLTAIVESDVEASRLRITDCNATRVGGREPRPNSIQLIRDGCSLMPQIMGNMIRGENGLEAPFTAFRIDGSDQIDIVCGIIVCKNRCDNRDSLCASIRSRRSAEERSADDMITVDQRLRVLVDNKPSASSSLLHMILDADSAQSEYCMNPTILFTLLVVFFLSLITLTIALTLLFCRKRNIFPLYTNSAELSSHIRIPRVERYLA